MGLKVTRNDVKPDESNPDIERIQLAKIESKLLNEHDFEYSAEVKVVIDGPLGPLAVLSRFRALPTDPDDTSGPDVYDRYFIFDTDVEGHIREIKRQSADPNLEMASISSPNEYLERCEQIANVPVAKYEVWKEYERERADRR